MLSALAPVTGETDCYGKPANELGSLEFNGEAFEGQLNYVEGYTGFSSNTSEQAGYFLPFTINKDAVKMYVNGEPVICDKAPAINVVFLGATKEISEKASLHLQTSTGTTKIAMTGITFIEQAKVKAVKASARSTRKRSK